MTPLHLNHLPRRLGGAFLGALIAIGALTGSVSAARSTHIDERYALISAVPITIPGASAYLEAQYSDVIGSDAGFQLWIEPALPWSSPPTYTSGRTEFVLGEGDSTLTGQFEILDRDANVVGSAVLDAALQPTGEPTETRWPKTPGNHKHRELQMRQPMVVTGTIAVTVGADQYVLPLDGASSYVAEFIVFENAPASMVDSATWADLAFLVTRGDITFQLSMHEDLGVPASEVVVRVGDQTLIGFDDGSATVFEGGRYAIDIALQSSAPGVAADVPTGATVTGSATVKPAERFLFVEDHEGATIRVAVQTYTVAGTFTVAFDDGTKETFTIDDANAYAEQVTFRLIAPAN